MKAPVAIILFILIFMSGCSSIPKAHSHPEPKVRMQEQISPPSAAPSPPAKEGRRDEQSAGTSAVYILPTRLEIPAIRLIAPVEQVGLLPNGEMGVPDSFVRVGILSPWSLPGQNGNAAIAGHVDSKTGPAVFYNLKKLKPDDVVFVSDDLGRRLAFKVRSVESFKTAESPLGRIFGESDKPRLNLITCTGKFNRKTKEHARRLVVFTELAETGG